MDLQQNTVSCMGFRIQGPGYSKKLYKIHGSAAEHCISAWVFVYRAQLGQKKGVFDSKRALESVPSWRVPVDLQSGRPRARTPFFQDPMA